MRQSVDCSFAACLAVAAHTFVASLWSALFFSLHNTLSEKGNLHFKLFASEDNTHILAFIQSFVYNQCGLGSFMHPCPSAFLPLLLGLITRVVCFCLPPNNDTCSVLTFQAGTQHMQAMREPDAGNPSPTGMSPPESWVLDTIDRLVFSWTWMSSLDLLDKIGFIWPTHSGISEK